MLNEETPEPTNSPVDNIFNTENIETTETTVEETAKRNLTNVTVAQTGCIGMCQYEPIAEVMVPGKEKVTYVQLTEEKVARIVVDHLVNGNPVAEYTVGAIAK